jgi:hypothetical protein
VNLPIVLRYYPWTSPFGFEVNRRLGGTLGQRAIELGSQWVRLNRVNWREIQPNEGDPYDWSVLSSFEDELRWASTAGFTPIVVVQHSPRWATINDPYETDCGAIRMDKLGAFAAFMQALVSRYKVPEFNVHFWELFNEPDVDPTLVAPDAVFGCWGDIDDPFYGGRHYGEMLKAVTPAIKAADPGAKVLVGGLLLATPHTSEPDRGTPEFFLQGILEAGAAPYFDILAYHSYTWYLGEDIDYDNGPRSGAWQPWGGWTVGKARFLRQTMGQYGVDKRLFLDETALGCNAEYWPPCEPPPATLFEAQADYVTRTFSRALSEDIRGFIWFTLDYPGWQNTPLLDGANNPRPAYVAYQHLIARLYKSRFVLKPDYGPEVEAYSFAKGPVIVQVAWSVDTTPDTIAVPQSKFLAAYNRDGAPLTPESVGTDYQFSVGFSPIFLELRP